MTTQSFFPYYRVEPERSDLAGVRSGYGSYYMADYYKNPQPYDSSDRGAPIPGWGSSVSVAGPAQVGVGATVSAQAAPSATPVMRAVSPSMMAMRRISSASSALTSRDVSASRPLPWWTFPVVSAIALGAFGYYGVKRGWF